MKLPTIAIAQRERPETTGYEAISQEVSATQGLIAAAEGAASSFIEAKDLTDYNNSYAEGATKLSALREGLENAPVIPLENAPEGTYDEQDVITGENGEKVVATYKVSPATYKKEAQSLLDNITADVSPRVKARLKQELGQKYFAPGYASVVADSLTKRKDAAREDMELNINMLTRIGDEEAAKQELMRGREMGLVDDFSTAFETIGTEIDKNNIRNQLMDADSIDDVDQISESVTTMRGDADSRNTIQREAETRRGELEAEREKRYTVGFSEGIQRSLTGRLNTSWINQMLKDDMLTPQNANTLRAITMQPPAEFSNPMEKNDITRQITSLRHVADTDMTVSEKADQIEAELYQKATGHYQSGEATGAGITIKAEDYAQLTNDLRLSEERAYTSPQYVQAKDSINLQTGIVGMLNLDGNGPNRMANDAFKAALNAHMDSKGAEADPLQFVEDNQNRYSVEVYKEEGVERFITAYPSFAGMAKEVQTKVGTSTQKMMTLNAKDLQGFINKMTQQGLMDPGEATEIMKDYTSWVGLPGATP